MFSLVSLFPDRTVRRCSTQTSSVLKQPSREMPVASKALPPLLHVAGELELDDAAGWASLGTAAHRVVGDLIQTGELSWRLQLEPGDPPVVVARTLEAAWRQVTARAGQSQHRM